MWRWPWTEIKELRSVLEAWSKRCDRAEKELEAVKKSGAAQGLRGRIAVSASGKEFSWRLVDGNRKNRPALAAQSPGGRSKTPAAAKEKLAAFLRRLKVDLAAVPCDVERRTDSGDVESTEEPLEI